MPQPLARIVDQLKREPSRTGSIVITVFGDSIVPRGGSVWLGTLLEFFKSLDIDGNVVRTAMSRLAADGWLERSKVGRNSFYRLNARGPADLRHCNAAHLRSAALGLDRPLRAAADRQCRGPRRRARGIEECRLRQPAARRVGRAVGRADP
ncbi:hypothetical protein AB7M56_005318 [Bradyrhizobium elkanii]